MNLPNLITLIRIILVPVMVIFLLAGKHGHALVVFVIAVISDGVDGFIARAFKQKTSLGAFLDPLADKLLLTTAYIILSVYHFVPVWLAVMIVSRDVIILSGLAVLSAYDRFPDIKPTIDSKITTFFQMSTVVYLLAYNHAAADSRFGAYLMLVTALMTAISGTRYIIIGFRLYDRINEESDQA
ncbi:MAG: CDP-alcohol phosphatidyltransferase family protein [Proteobacteria bacterium]|nr:CDP-alcohol phosphatidyltransferase family protein [Pseudomonadota bacterium]MBU1739052.1 CDP-alcohol phosphatidyltransferase family protein [Pseudomonadota bacterium]